MFGPLPINLWRKYGSNKQYLLVSFCAPKLIIYFTTAPINNRDSSLQVNIERRQRVCFVLNRTHIVIAFLKYYRRGWNVETRPILMDLKPGPGQNVIPMSLIHFNASRINYRVQSFRYSRLAPNQIRLSSLLIKLAKWDFFILIISSLYT